MVSILHPALRLLLRRQLKARWRKLIRGTRTIKGKLGLVAILAVFGMSVAPMALVALIREPIDDPESVRSMIASGLFLLTILTVVGQGQDTGVVFSPAEVDFLFPAPFGRRDLLIYRLAGLGMGAMFSALFFSMLAVAYASHWVFAFLGFALAVQFIQLVSMALGLTISIVGQAAYSRGRKFGLTAIAVIVVAGMIQAGSDLPEEGALEWTRLFASTSAGRLLLSPFQVFAHAVTAELLSGWLGWVCLGVALNLTLAALILRLDVNFLERSAATSQQAYLKLQRLRAGQGWVNLARPAGARWRLPMPGRWRGAGPIAWRQLIGALRGARGIVYFLLIMGVFGMLVVGQLPALSFSVIVLGPLAMMSVTMLPQMLRCDFRGELDNMDALKTLPMSSAAIAAGELIAPVAVASLLELPVVILIGLYGQQLILALTIGAFLPNLNLLIFALENLIFLWYPQRAPHAGELSGAGRRLLTSIIKVLMVGIVGGVAAGAGAVVYFLAWSWPAALATSWIIVFGCALGLIPLLARAFDRFDQASVPAD
ncbi:MAG TPA: putative ABC exporter domain-containing protein [Terriglobia bacterium]|nr:putative ABC exporter domain-containing protein [Terriglobia bacterium]